MQQRKAWNASWELNIPHILQQYPASWARTAVGDALWYLRSRDAGDQTLWKAQHLSLSVTPSGETSAEQLENALMTELKCPD